MHKRVHKKCKRQQAGMMLVTLLGMLTVLSMILISTALLATNLTRSTTKRMDKSDSANTADAGIDLGIAWLESLPSPPDDAALHPLNNFWGASTDAQGRAVINTPFGKVGSQLTVGIYADNANESATQKHYMIESTATAPNGSKTVVRAYVQQVSFSKYAFFADIDSGGFWDWHNHFEGPFHSNCSDGKPSTFLWNSNPPAGTTPIFNFQGSGALETTMTPVWWKNTINTKIPPATATEWNTIAAAGLASISINANNFISMPVTNYTQAYIALGQTPPATATSAPSSGVPTRTGVTLAANGGIYIHGDCQSFTLSANSTNTQTFTIVTAPTGYTLTQTVTATATYTSVTSVLKTTQGVVIPSTTAPANQYPNMTINKAPIGLIYCDGNINSLCGTIADNTVDSTGQLTYRNQWNISTDTGASKNIQITNSLTYLTQRNFDLPQSADTDYNLKAGTLGLIAKNVNLAKTAPAQVDINGVIYCTGSFQAADSTVKMGMSATMTEVGGVIVKQSGLFATADNYGNLTSGWRESYHYDSRLADYPPPYFPTTGNHYVVASYQLANSTLQ